MSTPQHQMIQTLLEQGFTVEQVAETVGLSLDELTHILQSGDFRAFAVTGPDEEDDEHAVSTAEALEWADAMTRPAMEALQAVLINPRTPATSKLKCAELILGWRAEFAQKKADAERRVVQHILIDSETLGRMQGFLNIIGSDEVQRQIAEARMIMPNSTA